jgi:serine protease Do
VLIDGEEYPATVVSTDARRDLALLKIDARELPVMPLADVSKASRQDEVLCFGYPLADLLGLDLSVENGRITSIRKTGGELRLQTNAPVKPGNSGGPMVNLRGEALGIISERIEIDGAPEGVAFAVPIDLASVLLQKIPDFQPVWGGGEEGLDAGEVDRKVSGAVFPILVRQKATPVEE